MLRRLPIIGALLLIAIGPSSAFASTITITWRSPLSGWFNGDVLSFCLQDGVGCEFWNFLQAHGISLAQPTPTPLTLSMTLKDAMPDAFGNYSTTADIHMEFGTLAIVSNNRLVGLGNGIGFLTDGSFGLGFNFDKLINFGSFTLPTFTSYMGNFGFTAGPNQSLAALFGQQTLQTLSVRNYCISIGNDCDMFGRFEAVKFSVPEPSPLAFPLGAVVGSVILVRKKRLATRAGSIEKQTW